MKNLTHYFQISKSPPDEPVSGSSAVIEESSDTQQNAEEDLVKVSEKRPPKPKKSTPKSRKSLVESESDEKCNPKSSVVVSPDSTVNTSGKKKRGKRNEISETTSEKDIKVKSPQKSFANSMQNILQRVLKKKFPNSSDGEDSSDNPNNKDCDKSSDSGEIEILDEISSSVTPKPGGKKRGRKPKASTNESNDPPSDKGKLSYEELESELMRERLLLAKLKETFLASNPDPESLAKYNSTLGPKKKINLNSSFEIGELPSTPKAGKLSNGVASGSKSTGNKPKSPKKPLWTPKSLAKSAMKNNSAKNTPEDSTKIMKEVLEHLDHSESKTVTPSPRKSPPKSKSSLSKDNTETKSKKHLEFVEVDSEKEDSERIKKKNKKDGDKSKEIPPVEIKKKTGKSPKKPMIKEKKTESPSQKKRQRKKKDESGDTIEELHVPNPASPVKKNVKISLDNEELIAEQEKNIESPAEKKRKRKKRSESTDDIEELLSPVPISSGKKRKKNTKIIIDSDEEQVSGQDKKTESLSEKKRKRRKISESANSVENIPVSSEKKNLKNCPDGGNEDEVSEQSSPPKKTKTRAKKKEVSVKKEAEKVAEKKKVTNRRSSGDNKKTRKDSLSKKSDTSAKSSIIKLDKTQKKEAVDLDSSSDSVFVVSSQKAKDIDNASQKTPKSKSKSKSESESAEKKTSKADSAQTDSSQKNSLLKYFGKVDKIFIKKEEKSTSLTTQAIVHSAPASPSRKRKSASIPFSPRRKKLKSMLADADKIELLSSEIVTNTNCDDSNDIDSQNETEKSDMSPGPSKPSPKKWSMRVKLAVQSPSKSSTAGEGSSSVVRENPSDESSPDQKVKRKLFSSKRKPSVEKSDESNSSESMDVQVIEEKSEGNTNQKETKKNVSTAAESKEITKSTPASKDSEIPKPPVKLASIFMKKSTPKTNSGAADSPIVIDDESLKAKKDFLSSGVPDIIKQKSEQSKALEKLEEEEYFVPFPKISHVGYENLNSSSDPMSELEKLFRLRPTTITTEIVNDCLKKSWENIIEPANQVPGTTDDHCWTKCNDIKRQQRYLKKQASNFPFEVFEKKFENISSKQNSVDKNQEMWTEKYKPRCSQEVIGNGACVTSLKQWLEEQKASKKKDSDGSSGDEFVSSDDDSSLSYRANNVAILTGPPGCGKTSSVYAVAKELGCKVLELNASYDRNGKKILGELLEATQSHQVKVSNILADMFSKTNKKGDKKRKKKELKKKLKSAAQDPESKVMSIILIEDADLIFSEHDDGFISALFSLSTLSKRPIILVANNVHSAHLSKFIKQQCLLLEYNKPSFADIKTWLQLIALYEAVELPSGAAEKIIYETTDVRQAILNLQYHLCSTLKPRITSNVDWPLDVGKLWWQWPSPFMLPPLSIPTVKQSKPIVLENSDERLQDSNASVPDPPSKSVVPSPEDRLKFHKLASFIDSLALAEVWSSSPYYTVHSEDPSPKSWHVKAEDSCLLNERNSLEHAGYDSISVALSHELISRHVRELDLKFENCVQNRISPDLDRWKKKHKKVEKILSTGLPLLEQVDRESVFCDYLPMIRSISRSECLRLAGNSKRSNRFFNYLSSLNMHPDERQRTLMCNSLVFYNETTVNS